VNTTFADLGVPARIVASLAERGIHEPFPIQALTMADTLAGRDVSGRAPTGSGKTLAFGIPLVIDCPRAEPRRPRRLVLVPTRELATQVAQELKQVAGRKGPRVATFFGGTNIRSDDRVLDRGVDIAVACPGRLTDLIQQRLVRLDDVDVVVLDEADRMADMGFLPQVRKLLDMCRSDRQTVLFSATLDGDVDVLVRRYQHDPVRHELELPEEELPDLTHHFWDVDRTERVAVAGQVIARMGPTVVFCRTKRGADRVAKQLGNAGVAAAAIHGDRSQNQRDRALEDFRSGRAAALVATDVAARGIHVDDVAAVIHFDPPEDHKDYVHRSGRTARAGAAGVVVSLVVPEKVSMVKGLQKSLDLPRGTGPIQLDALVGSAPTSPTSVTAAPSNRRSRTEARRSTQDDRRQRPKTTTGDRTTKGDLAANGDRTTKGDTRPDRSTRPERAPHPERAEHADSADTPDSPRRRRHRRRHDADPRRSSRRTGNGSTKTSGTAGTTSSGRSRRTADGAPEPSAPRRNTGSKPKGGPRKSGKGPSSQSRSSRPSSRGPR